MKATAGDFVAGVFFVALIYVLVRPNSAATAAVKLFSDAMVSLVRTVTDM